MQRSKLSLWTKGAEDFPLHDNCSRCRDVAWKCKPEKHNVFGGKAMSCIPTEALSPSDADLHHRGGSIIQGRKKSKSAAFNELVNFTTPLSCPPFIYCKGWGFHCSMIVYLHTMKTLALLDSDKEMKAFPFCCLEAGFSCLPNHRSICLCHPIRRLSLEA